MGTDRTRRRIPDATVSRLPVYLRILGEHAFTRFVEIKRKEWEDYRVQVTPFEVQQFLPVL